MAHFQSEYDRDKTTDEFGNPIRRTEDPVHHGVTGATAGYGSHDTTGTGYGTHGTTGTDYGTHGTTGTGFGTHGIGPTGFAATTAGGVTSVPLHRSDSSSSSEDDGYGGRRKKKGLKEKIKEKLPGGKHRSDDPYGATTTPYGGGQHQEKGMMDKIKEKLPGHH
ncbi:hypothetical protein ACLB2K_003422 [Fragaria x ananassa]